jgi:hypothetical protein
MSIRHDMRTLAVAGARACARLCPGGHAADE